MGREPRIRKKIITDVPINSGSCHCFVVSSQTVIKTVSLWFLRENISVQRSVSMMTSGVEPQYSLSEKNVSYVNDIIMLPNMLTQNELYEFGSLLCQRKIHLSLVTLFSTKFKTRLKIFLALHRPKTRQSR